MLAAYYSRGADSKDIFQNLKIGKETKCEHQNQYDVIFLDITLFLSIADTPDLVVKEIQKDIIQELKSVISEFSAYKVTSESFRGSSSQRLKSVLLFKKSCVILKRYILHFIRSLERNI